MAYSTEEAREALLDDLAQAIEQLGLALAAAGEAYEVLDDRSADELEQRLFRPVQRAYGRARRTHQEFAARHQLAERTFADAGPGQHSADPRAYIDRAVLAAQRADQEIAELQDSMMPVEVGDVELRAGLSETRSLIADVPVAGLELLRTLGR